MFLRFALVCALCVSSTGSIALAQDRGALASGFHQYVAGEENDFADLRGEETSDDGTYVYYASSVALPGSSACVIYIYKKSGHRYGTCDFDAATLDDAKVLFGKIRSAFESAEPGWTYAPVTNHVVAYVGTDAQKAHGIYLYVSKSDDQKSYRVTTTFGTPSALK